MINSNIPEEEFQFRNDPRLRAANTVYKYTPEELSEIIKCYKDPLHEYFIEKYVKLITLDKGLSNINLRFYQKKALELFSQNRFVILMFSRQTGKTTIAAIEALTAAMFKPYQEIVILANKDKTAKGILNRIKNIIMNLPIFIQQGIVNWNAHLIEFENGSKISCSATSPSAIRSASCNLVIMDEVAMIPSNLWKEFYTSVYPTITSGETTRIILISTPKGQNHFYKLWTDAKSNRNNYVPYEIIWKDTGLFDDAWSIKTKMDIGEREFYQEYECSFVGSTNTLIETKKLENLVYKDSIEVPEDFKNKIFNKSHLNYLKLYELPKPKHIYSIGVDTSKLSEDISGDAMCIQVLDITDIKFKQVATYYIPDNVSITYMDFPEIIFQLASFYNLGIVFVENNEIGQQIADIIWMDYEYGNLFFEKQNLSGFRTTKRTKRIGVSNLKLFIENEKLELNDFTTISQLTTFVKVKNSYRADVGKQDDSVSALLAALFILQIQDYKSDRNRIEMLQAIKSGISTFDEDLELGSSFFIDPNENTMDINNILSDSVKYTPLEYSNDRVEITEQEKLKSLKEFF
jgi:hypothetical protein